MPAKNVLFVVQGLGIMVWGSSQRFAFSLTSRHVPPAADGKICPRGIRACNPSRLCSFRVQRQGPALRLQSIYIYIYIYYYCYSCYQCYIRIISRIAVITITVITTITIAASRGFGMYVCFVAGACQEFDAYHGPAPAKSARWKAVGSVRGFTWRVRGT